MVRILFNNQTIIFSKTFFVKVCWVNINYFGLFLSKSVLFVNLILKVSKSKSRINKIKKFSAHLWCTKNLNNGLEPLRGARVVYLYKDPNKKTRGKITLWRALLGFEPGTTRFNKHACATYARFRHVMGYGKNIYYNTYSYLLYEKNGP